MDYLYDERRRGGAPLVVGIIIVVLVVAYLGGALFFRKHLIPGSIINGVNCSMKDIAGAKEAIREEVKNYTLTLVEREDNSESIKGADVGIEVEFDSEMDKLYDMQQAFAWPVGLFKKVGKDIGVTVSLDDKMLNDTVDALSCFEEDRYRNCADAYVEYNDADQLFAVVPEDMGTELDKDVVVTTVHDAITGLKNKVDLSEEGCYIDPKHYEKDKEVIEACDTANKYLSTSIKYVFGDETFDLPAKTVAGFIKIAPDTFKVSFKRKPMVTYVTEMSDKYNTIYKTKTFKTSYGYDVTLNNGDYGWWINEGETITQIKSLLEEGKSGEYEPVYYQRATAFGDNDIGDSYVEVNLSMQHVLLYSKGKLVDESDCVTGKNNAYTPPGVYSITYKDHTYDDHQVALVGENYSSDVMYFMPFFGNIGLHDASWRSQFGGTIYKKSGSHGCVNLPLSMAESIFNTVEKEMAVVVYQDPKNPAYDSKAKMSEIYEGN